MLMCDGSARGWLAGDTDGLAGDGGTSVGDGDECRRRAGWCTKSRAEWETVN